MNVEIYSGNLNVEFLATPPRMIQNQEKKVDVIRANGMGKKGNNKKKRKKET